MSDNPQDQLDLYFLSRQVVWRQKLDQYDNEVLKRMQQTIAKAKKEIATKFEQQILRTEIGAARAEEVLFMLDDLSHGILSILAEHIAEAAAHAGEHSLAEHSDILSVGGAATAVETVSMPADQMRAFFVDTPLGGKTLAEWVDSAFDATVREGMREELNAGVLQGEGYPKLVKRLTQGFDDLSRQDAVTLARSYVQSANVAAMQAVYQRNSDVVKQWKWSAVLEGGFSKSGHGTCCRCAALDGQTFDLGAGPAIPLHPNCRCVACPITVTWRDLGINLDELEAAARPYTIRPDKAIDAGGRRTIEEVGFHQGDYSSFFGKQDATFQRNAVGPGRLALLQSGKIEFKDLVDGAGDLRTIKELEAMAK
jgi:SPP1 gp7 family putative phage head morphogenesis protein